MQTRPDERIAERSTNTISRVTTVLGSSLRGLADRLGYEVRRKVADEGDAYLGTGPDRERLQRVIELVRPYTMLSPARLVTLYRQVRHLERQRVPGAFVECGVWKGGAVATMALANQDAGAPARDLHLFDAFDDICEPDPAIDGAEIMTLVREALGDIEVAGRLRPMKGAYDGFGGHGTIAAARRIIEGTVGYDRAKVHFHPGWFQDTLPVKADAIGPIALLRLDGDYYASIKVCLEHLYDKVVPGGFVVIDDYGLFEGCTRAVDEFIASRGLDAFLGSADHVTRCHVYWMKR